MRRLIPYALPGPTPLSALLTPYVTATPAASSVTLNAVAITPPAISTFSFWQYIGSAWTLLTTQASGSYSVTGLTAGTTYQFYVTQNTSETPSRASAPVFISATPQITVPAQVTGLTVTGTTSSTISLVWIAASTATSYIVYRNGSQIGTTSNLTYTDSPLSANTTYTYTVAGVNAAGTGAQSLQASGVTKSAGTGIALLTYLKSLMGQGKVLSGQHADYFCSGGSGQYGNQLDQMSNTGSAATTTIGSSGLATAILGMVFGGEGNNLDFNSTAAQVQKLSNDWISAGGIVMGVFDPANPSANIISGNGTNCFTGANSVLTPGSKYYNAVFHGQGSVGTASTYKGLDGCVADLKALNGKPCILRIMQEQNGGNWFWWNVGSNGGPTIAQWIELYQMIVNYIRAAGVTNVLFCYNTNWYSGNYAALYPGASYVDVFGIDVYTNSIAGVGGAGYNALVGLSSTTPILMCEVGVENSSSVQPNTGNNQIFGNVVNQTYPNIVATVVFCQNWALQLQNGATTYMQNSINRSQVPALV